MKIRMLTGIAGPNIDFKPKEETDAFSDGEALRLMLSDRAEPADDESAVALAGATAAGGFEPDEGADDDSGGGGSGSGAGDSADVSKPDELDAITNTMKLKSVAKAENVDLGEARTLVDIRAAIRAHRVAAAA